MQHQERKEAERGAGDRTGRVVFGPCSWTGQTQRNPCLVTPGGRADLTGDVNVCRGGSFYRRKLRGSGNRWDVVAPEWRSGRTAVMTRESAEKETPAGRKLPEFNAAGSSSRLVAPRRAAAVAAPPQAWRWRAYGARKGKRVGGFLLPGESVRGEPPTCGAAAPLLGVSRPRQDRCLRPDCWMFTYGGLPEHGNPLNRAGPTQGGMEESTRVPNPSSSSSPSDEEPPPAVSLSHITERAEDSSCPPAHTHTHTHSEERGRGGRGDGSETRLPGEIRQDFFLFPPEELRGRGRGRWQKEEREKRRFSSCERCGPKKQTVIRSQSKSRKRTTAQGILGKCNQNKCGSLALATVVTMRNRGNKLVVLISSERLSVSRSSSSETSEHPLVSRRRKPALTPAAPMHRLTFCRRKKSRKQHITLHFVTGVSPLSTPFGEHGMIEGGFCRASMFFWASFPLVCAVKRPSWLHKGRVFIAAFTPVCGISRDRQGKQLQTVSVGVRAAGVYNLHVLVLFLVYLIQFDAPEIERRQAVNKGVFVQDDQVVLQCTASVLKEQQIKLCLSCEGFGNRLCFLETTSNAQVTSCSLLLFLTSSWSPVGHLWVTCGSPVVLPLQNVPPDLAICTFILEQSLSVRALVEMLANTVEMTEVRLRSSMKLFLMMGRRIGIAWPPRPTCLRQKRKRKLDTHGALDAPPSSQGGGHRTLLYGHAILLRHHHSGMYLSCLTTSRSLTDKLAFDVGLQEDSIGEACWWTIHPASKQRSEGEKVRVGDDLILVSVSSERYLHLSYASGDLMVDASFMQTLWNMNPISSGCELAEGYLTGGHVLRLFHGHMDECLAIPTPEEGEEKRRTAHYEGGAVCSQARSLWRLEPLRISWSGSHMKWGVSFRIRHITTGRYLCLDDDKVLMVVDPEKSNTKMSAFCFRISKEKVDVSQKRDVEGMGIPEIKYGESMCFVQHVSTGLWLTYAALDAKAARLGTMKRRVILHQEGHMDDALTVSRSQTEESQAARMIYSTTGLFRQFIKGLDSLSGKNKSPGSVSLPLEGVILSLQDLIFYFRPPEEELEHEEKQTKLRSLRNRQNLFQEEETRMGSSGVARVRFLLGGRHGDFKFMPPPGYAPCYEALLPRERMRIEPIKEYKHDFDGVRNLLGPTLSLTHTSFTPCPVDTVQIVLPPHLERIREKLAENIHELWAVTRIEQGWTYGSVKCSSLSGFGADCGPLGVHMHSNRTRVNFNRTEAEFRDDNKKLHPCLVDFQSLPEPEKNYNLQMSGETLKTLLALGCHVGMGDEKAEENLKKIKLPKTYVMSNGYKPAPLDLNHVKLTPNQNQLVEKLAENGHNVWARDRVRQGWTYSIVQDIVNKRNPRLVPYNLLDERTKKTNRDSVNNAVRTLIGYGYNIEPPDQESTGQGLENIRGDKVRIFRAEKSYAVTQGKWYFEFEALTIGEMRVGWARPCVRSDTELGADELAYVFNGNKAQRWHVGNEPFGRQWQSGDVVGCMIDLNEMNIMFTLNGEMLISDSGSEMAFKDIEVGEGFIPVCALGLSQIGRINLGQNVSSLRYFAICGLQEGFEPFAINMKRDITMWFSKSLPQFVPVPTDHHHIEVIQT
ncbi:hypothetical protein CCH79_00018223 [Gambusia affinis]|uniref:Ryanodine receptor 1 n=1 Tax=Gambusia affinis TaxID=33528 RepID=A0A315VFY9_GAMAF|nr:hypothetical protein CCH79_00018223 [Gambusia affinis]